MRKLASGKTSECGGVLQNACKRLGEGLVNGLLTDHRCEWAWKRESEFKAGDFGAAVIRADPCAEWITLLLGESGDYFVF